MVTPTPRPSDVECVRRPHTVWTVCRCGPCRQDRRRLVKRRRNGYYRRVAAQDAWAEMDRLWLERGWYPSAIASAAGVSDRMLQNAVAHRRATGVMQQFGPVVSAKIVNHGEPTSGSISVIPARRRLQALAVMGWGLKELAVATGFGQSSVAGIRNRRQTTFVSVQRHLVVAEVYKTLSARPGPSLETAKRAREKGWKGPLHWEDPDLIPDRAARG